MTHYERPARGYKGDDSARQTQVKIDDGVCAMRQASSDKTRLLLLRLLLCAPCDSRFHDFKEALACLALARGCCMENPRPTIKDAHMVLCCRAYQCTSASMQRIFQGVFQIPYRRQARLSATCPPDSDFLVATSTRPEPFQNSPSAIWALRSSCQEPCVWMPNSRQIS